MREWLIIVQKWSRADRDWRTVDSFTLFGLNDMGRALLQGRQWDSRIIVQEVPEGEAVVWRGNGAEGVSVSGGAESNLAPFA
jgi:hypothetical protein